MALDRWLGTSPWGVLTGIGLGLVVGFYELVKGARIPPDHPEDKD